MPDTETKSKNEELLEELLDLSHNLSGEKRLLIARMGEVQKRIDSVQTQLKVEKFAKKNNLVISPEGIKSAESVKGPA